MKRKLKILQNLSYSEKIVMKFDDKHLKYPSQKICLIVGEQAYETSIIQRIPILEFSNIYQKVSHLLIQKLFFLIPLKISNNSVSVNSDSIYLKIVL